MGVLEIILIAKNVASLLRDLGLSFEDVGHLVAQAQAEGREVNEQDVYSYIKKRKDALAALDAAVARALKEQG